MQELGTLDSYHGVDMGLRWQGYEGENAAGVEGLNLDKDLPVAECRCSSSGSRISCPEAPLCG